MKHVHDNDLDPIQKRYQKLVYRIEFPDKAIYFGLATTSKMESRQKQRKLNPNDAVTRYANETNQDYKISIVKDKLSMEEAQDLERQKIIQYSAKPNYHVLNQRNGGQPGHQSLQERKYHCYKSKRISKYRDLFESLDKDKKKEVKTQGKSLLNLILNRDE
jgi:hypothetical protein